MLNVPRLGSSRGLAQKTIRRYHQHLSAVYKFHEQTVATLYLLAVFVRHCL